MTIPILLHKVSFHFRRLPEYFIVHPVKYFHYLYLRYHGVETRYGYVKLEGLPIISKAKGSRIILGKGCTLVSRSRGNIAGINHPVILATLTPNAIIQIGAVGISGASICAATKITIGDYSGLGANSNIYDTDFHPVDAVARRNQRSILDANTKEVSIGRDVWVASNVTILKGVEIGDEAVIAAGAVVTKSVPPKTVFGGNPAKKIRDLS